MIYEELGLKGAYMISFEPIIDHRGYFARVWDAHEFEEHGLETRVVQCNVSFNSRKGTIRGLHFQRRPHEEVKLVRCTRGAVFDVVVDIRPGSPTQWRWEGVDLTAANGRMVYVPRGFAHGYQTLEDGTEVTYQVSEFYHPESEGSLLWSDPAVGIKWPLDEVVVSDKDRAAPTSSARRP